jgi:aminobenzoyl-glutamate utilization protein A
VTGLSGLLSLVRRDSLDASEDATYLMKAVSENGGKAIR